MLNRSDLESLPTEVKGFPVIFGNNTIDFLAFYVLTLFAVIAIISIIVRLINRKRKVQDKSNLVFIQSFPYLFVTALSLAVIFVLVSLNSLLIEMKESNARNETKVQTWIAKEYGITGLSLNDKENRFPYFENQRENIWLTSNDGKDYLLVTEENGNLKLKTTIELEKAK